MDDHGPGSDQALNEARDRETLVQLVNEDCVEFGEFMLKSGVISPYYIDLRQITLTSIGLQVIGRLISSRWQDLRAVHKLPEADLVGGPCVGADPIVGAVLTCNSDPSGRGFLVRAEEKDHGKAGCIIGPVRKDDTAIVIEDVTTSGASLLGAANAVQKLGVEVLAAITVLDRGAGATKLFSLADIPFAALLTLDDLDLEEHQPESPKAEPVSQCSPACIAMRRLWSWIIRRKILRFCSMPIK